MLIRRYREVWQGGDRLDRLPGRGRRRGRSNFDACTMSVRRRRSCSRCSRRPWLPCSRAMLARRVCGATRCGQRDAYASAPCRCIEGKLRHRTRVAVALTSAWR